jgi:hypothetical protein
VIEVDSFKKKETLDAIPDIDAVHYLIQFMSGSANTSVN